MPAPLLLARTRATLFVRPSEIEPLKTVEVDCVIVRIAPFVPIDLDQAAGPA